jgi:2-phospho-L-lactate guanylyltransferase (CobY/MobA/RfbA family)
VASKHMVRSRNHTRAIKSQLKAAMDFKVAAMIPTEIVVIADDIRAMSNADVAAALTHARRSCKVTPDRQQQLQAEWMKRLAALE